jgi:choline dehydrogenase-like flavoprotein
MRRFSDDDEVDLVIVGCGAGGSVLAQQLARAGWRVVALDAGPFWDPDTDWVSDEAGSHHLYWTDPRVITGAPRSTTFISASCVATCPRPSCTPGCWSAPPGCRRPPRDQGCWAKQGDLGLPRRPPESLSEAWLARLDAGSRIAYGC